MSITANLEMLLLNLLYFSWLFSAFSNINMQINYLNLLKINLNLSLIREIILNNLLTMLTDLPIFSVVPFFAYYILKVYYQVHTNCKLPFLYPFISFWWSSLSRVVFFPQSQLHTTLIQPPIQPLLSIDTHLFFHPFYFQVIYIL